MNRIQLREKYTAMSYGGILAKSVFLVVIVANIWLFMESVSIAPIRFTLDGGLADFVPDKYISMNLYETGHNVLNTSLFNDATAWFVYIVYLILFMICPLVV